MKNNKIFIRFSEGKANLGKVKNKTLAWESLCARLGKPTRTRETFKAYQKMTQSEKLAKKSVDGYFCAAPVKKDTRRLDEILDRDLLTIDIDENAEGLLEAIEMRELEISKYEFFAHTTRSHSPENPSVRIVIPLSVQLSREDHTPVSRIISQLIDPTMRMIDPVSHRPAQMMFWPTASSDGVFWSHRNTGNLLDYRTYTKAFAEKHGSWQDYSVLPANPEREDELRKSAEKAEDPTTKEGPVGVWCRTYRVEDVIEKFLSDVYEPADHTGNDTRYTPKGSKGAAGVVVYDDGLFLTSNHTTDPCAGLSVNAWDLMRISKFGDLDDGADSRTKINNLPSFKAMMKLAQDDAGYKKTLMAESVDQEAIYEEMMDDLDLSDADIFDAGGKVDRISDKTTIEVEIDDLIGSAEDPSKTKTEETLKEDPPDGKEWTTKLECNKNGDILPSLNNTYLILRNDVRFRGRIAFNELTGYEVFRENVYLGKTIPRVRLEGHHRRSQNGRPVEDGHESLIRLAIGQPNGHGHTGYGFEPGQKMLQEAINAVGKLNTYDPIKMAMESVDWDGEERLETLFIRYLGLPDDSYHRRVSFCTVMAMVARTYEPGYKFDCLPILEGGQGVRKSSFCKALAMNNWFVEVSGDISDPQKAAERTSNALVAELAELQTMRKSESDSMKSWLSRQEERVRMAYERRATTIRRRFIAMGTINEGAYLRDPTGERRYWPLKITVPFIDTVGLVSEMPQVFAEGLAVWQKYKKEKKKLILDLITDEQKAIQKTLTDEAKVITPEMEMAGQIEEWLDTPVPLQAVLGFDGLNDIGEEGMKLVYRTKVCPLMVLTEMLEGSKGNPRGETQRVARAMAMVEGLERRGQGRFRLLGRQMVYVSTRQNPNFEEIAKGYMFVEDADDLI